MPRVAPLREDVSGGEKEGEKERVRYDGQATSKRERGIGHDGLDEEF